MKHHYSTHARLCLTLTALLPACTRDNVDLGGDTITRNLERGTRCATSTALAEDVIVSNQEELDALSGCEEIEGNLIVRIFPGADLTPLGALRVVEGQFALGVRQTWDEIAGFGVSDRLDSDVELLRAGWVSSLDGVQSLERVGALFLRGAPGEDLTAFESLTSIGGSLGGIFQGEVILQQNLQLRSLAGFEDVANARHLVATLSPELESLRGLPASPLLTVSLYNSPRLADLSALGTLTTLTGLTLYGIGVRDLGAFSNLTLLEGSVTLSGNAALVDASGLSNLQTARGINITDNAVLKVLPSFRNFFQQPDVITITGNPELEQVELDFSQAPTQVYDIDAPDGSGADSTFEVGPDVIDVSNNALLRSIRVPAGLTTVNLGLVQNNPSLVRLELETLREFGRLSINANAALTEVEAVALDQVGLLQVTNNPQLSTAVFDGVRTTTREVHPNLE
jgi:hypothetical protein